jgi:hypothetical protein
MKMFNKSQVNPSTHQRTMPPRTSQTAACSTLPSQAQDHSETEPESEIEVLSDLESQPDREIEYVIENQLGLPEYQRSIIRSSPPPVPVNANTTNESNSSEFIQ